MFTQDVELAVKNTPAASLVMVRNIVTLTVATLLAHASAQCDDEEQYQCDVSNTGPLGEPVQECVIWNKVMDGQKDCPLGDDENVGKIDFCPQAFAPTGADAYMTFRIDPGKDYASINHQLKPLDLQTAFDLATNYWNTEKLKQPFETQSVEESAPCKPFYYDSNGDGVTEYYDSCTRACTDAKLVQTAGQPFVLDASLQSYNPDNCDSRWPSLPTFPCLNSDAAASTKVGCRERLYSDQVTDRQRSRLWCATEVDGALKPTKIRYCKERCAQDGDGDTKYQFREVDEYGNRCNPYLAMPYLAESLSAVPAKGNFGAPSNSGPTKAGPLRWTFNTKICNLPITAGEVANAQTEKMGETECLQKGGKMVSKPLHEDFKYYLDRAWSVSKDTESSFQIVVYHEKSPQLAATAGCSTNNPTCCQFSVRIMDGARHPLCHPLTAPPLTAPP